MLYRVTGKRIKESYILCVDENLPASALVGVKDVFKCYNHSEMVVCEMVIDEKRAVETTHASSVLVSQLIGTDEAAMVDSTLWADMGISLKQLERFKPSAIGWIWEKDIVMGLYNENNEDEYEGMDSYFQKVAALEGKEVIGIEEYDGTNGWFDGNLNSQAREMVRKMRQGSDEVERRYWQADSLYRAGDADGLAAMQMEEMTEAEKVEKIDMRMERWAERLVEMMKEKRCFVILSVKYVKSEGGVIEMMGKKRLNIKAI